MLCRSHCRQWERKRNLKWVSAPQQAIGGRQKRVKQWWFHTKQEQKFQEQVLLQTLFLYSQTPWQQLWNILQVPQVSIITTPAVAFLKQECAGFLFCISEGGRKGWECEHSENCWGLNSKTLRKSCAATWEYLTDYVLGWLFAQRLSKQPTQAAWGSRHLTLPRSNMPEAVHQLQSARMSRGNCPFYDKNQRRTSREPEASLGGGCLEVKWFHICSKVVAAKH